MLRKERHPFEGLRSHLDTTRALRAIYHATASGGGVDIKACYVVWKTDASAGNTPVQICSSAEEAELKKEQLTKEEHAEYASDPYAGRCHTQFSSSKECVIAIGNDQAVILPIGECCLVGGGLNLGFY